MSSICPGNFVSIVFFTVSQLVSAAHVVANARLATSPGVDSVATVVTAEENVRVSCKRFKRFFLFFFRLLHSWFLVCQAGTWGIA